MMEELPFLTVVMPVRNEARFIGDTLQQLLTQEYPANRYEIIIADGMSDDGTREIVKDIARTHSQIQLLDNPKEKSGAGRNVGFKNGRGDIFLVVDGHCYIPDAHLFKNTVECLEKSGADCLGRPQPLNPPGLTRFQKAVALARASWLGHGGDSLIYGEYEGFASPVSNGATYKKHVFDRVGYVDEGMDAAEDVEFNYRIEKAGLCCYTSPKLTIRYYPRESIKTLFCQLVRYGRGRRRFLRKHPQAMTKTQLIPPVFALYLFLAAASLSVILWHQDMAWLPTLVISPYFFYTLLILVVSIQTAASAEWYHLIILPFIYLLIHFSLGWGFLIEVVSGDKE